MAVNTPRTSQLTRRKAALLADQVVQAATGTPPEISGGVPAANAVLARPAVRYALMLAAATLAVLAWHTRKRR